MRPGLPIARSRRVRLTAVAVSAALLGGSALALPAGAQDDPFGADEGKKRTERAVGFLQAVQNADGGLPLKRGGDSDPAASAWAALAVASARISPRDQTVKGGTSLWQYLQEESGELRSTDDLARLALVARAAKSSAEKVGDATPIATITSRQAAEGGIADAGTGTVSVTTTAWAVLALPDGPTRRKARTWLVDQRDARTGAWPAVPGEAGDAVATGLALQALRKTVPVTATFGFLRDLQNTGGLARRKGGAPDALATALVIQGSFAAGTDADRQRLSEGTNDPTSFLWKRQAKSGAVGSVLATAQVAPALASRPYPLAAVSSKGPTNTGTPVADEEPEDEGTETNEVQPTDPAPVDGGSTAPNAVVGGQGDDDSEGTTATGGGSGAPGDVAGVAPPATTSAAPPATTTTGAAPPTSTTPGDQVTGAVVGSTDAAPAAATTGGGGGGDDDEDRTALALFGVIVLFVALGAWLERRPTRIRGVTP